MNTGTRTPPTAQSAKSAQDKGTITLPPDMPILIEARIKAGEKTLQIKAISNLILHDPVLTLEVLQYANSVMFSGSAVRDVESAITRMGVARLITLLSELNSKTRVEDADSLDAFEILRYNCRRISIVSMIVAAVGKPTSATAARIAGLFGDIGHMVALHQLGHKYIDIAKSNKRKNIAFRLEKDLGYKLQAKMLAFLAAKGVPRAYSIAFDLDEQPKGASEVELRLVIQTACEMIEAFDSGKFATYAPDGALSTQASVRLLRLTKPQIEKLYKTVGDYLRASAAEEAPEGASLLISSVDEEEGEKVDVPSMENIRIPTYPNLCVNAKSREALQYFFNLCERERDLDNFNRLATGYLRDSGLFERSALIRVNQEGSKAKILEACGLSQRPGEEIAVTDPLSPFKVLRLEIKSASARANKVSAPFGASAYAIGPVDLMPGGESLVLYVDRSAAQALSMESRRVFRLALGLYMRTVQTIKGESPAAQQS